ncbi:DUF6470 family protein [Anaerovorax odorimutans]|uniref:DUF6470 family protein n=1 Tax=Anaerovorax odorimutans TaxID=109327 RepID=UPI0003F9E08D|nr:DUF6470 family protein [Anaerovorax odorimutans]
MKPLIEIKTIPISIEFKVTPSKIQRSQGMAELEISREKKGLSIKSRPIKLNVDSFEARNSVVPSTATSSRQFGENGITAAYEATAQFAEEGNMLLNIHLNQDTLGQIADSRMSQPADFNIGFIPEYPADISWEPGDLSIQYEMDKLNFDWKIGQGNYEFIPGNIEFIVKEYPKVIIEYVGGPIYAPPSADPDYEPIDIKA